MGRPLSKQQLFNANNKNNIKVQFHNGTTSVPGYIVEQTGSKRFKCKDANGNTAVCYLKDKAAEDLAAGEMSITFIYDDGTVQQATKIARHKATFYYDGKRQSMPWNFSTSTTDGAWQIEEAGSNSALSGNTDLEGDEAMVVTVAAAGGATSIDEGSGLTFNVSGSYIPNGTYYWTVTNSGDFGTSSGSFSITSNSGSFSVTPTADTTTEGAETFTVSVRSGSISGTVLATSSSITINDTSLSGYTWTAPSGWAGYEIFNGSSQRLSVPASSDWAPGTGAFTIEFVTNFQSGGGNFPRVFSLGTYPSATVACSIEGTDNPTIYFWINGSIAASISTAGGAFSGMPSFRNNFHHVVLQRNASGWCNIYIDGNKVTNNTTPNTYNLANTTSDLAIAVEPQVGGTYSNWIKGYLTNFRWTNAAVYPDTSFTVMSAALTALPQTKLLLLMASSGTLNDDSSGSAKTVTAVGTPTWHVA